MKFFRLFFGLTCLTTSLAAQSRPPIITGPLGRALAAERRGDLAEAAKAFGAVLDTIPADGQALLGIARVLPHLERRAELVPRLARAIAIDSNNIGFLALGVRTHALLGARDSARSWVERWARLREGEEEPYREWAMSALEARDQATARIALELGRQRIAHPAALAAELAQLRQSEGDVKGAVAEWVLAVSTVPSLQVSAVALLENLALRDRETALQALRQHRDSVAAQIEGLLLMAWGNPEDGIAVLGQSLPANPDAASNVLRNALDQLKGRSDPAANRARGLALSFLADRQHGDAAVRSRMEAARAFADAGEEADARRLLQMVATDPAAPQGIATSASSTLLGVLIAEGQPAQAESLLAVIGSALSLDEREREARRVAMAWARSGNLIRAEQLLSADSTVQGLDARGRVRAFAGDLAAATELLRIAGPYDDEREHAVGRVSLLTLLHAVNRPNFPELGAALLTLERNDTATAVSALASLAESLEPTGAGAVRYFAGELATARGDTVTAIRLLVGADSAQSPGSAPAARLAHSRILLAQNQPEAATELLESIIIEFPDSAVVPAARRLRDAIRGAVPGGSR